MVFDRRAGDAEIYIVFLVSQTSRDSPRNVAIRNSVMTGAKKVEIGVNGKRGPANHQHDDHGTNPGSAFLRKITQVPGENREDCHEYRDSNTKSKIEVGVASICAHDLNAIRLHGCDDHRGRSRRWLSKDTTNCMKNCVNQSQKGRDAKVDGGFHVVPFVMQTMAELNEPISAIGIRVTRVVYDAYKVPYS